MGKAKGRWGKISLSDKIFMAVIITLSSIVIILSALGLFGGINIVTTNSIVMPIAGTITLLNGIKMYKKNKPTAIFQFCCSAFIILCSISVFYLKFFK